MNNQEIFSMIKRAEDNIRIFKTKISQGIFVEDYKLLLKRAEKIRENCINALKER